MKVCALLKESVHSVETAPKTNFMSCFNVRSMMRFANPFIDMHVHMNNRLIPMTKLRSFLFLFSSPHMICVCAKTCFSILQRRLFFLSK